MKKLWSLITSAIRAIFCHETISKVWQILFGAGKSSISSLLADPGLMDAAFDFSLSLALGADTVDKRATFDAQFSEWAKDRGYAIGTAALNAIRETAYAAVQAQLECPTCHD